MAKNSTIDIERLARLEPISALSNERLDELAKLAYVERVSIGVSLFREGDLDNQTLYLLHGDVQLTSSDGNFDEVISSRHNSAKFPLDDSQPRQLSCVALGLVEFLRIDNSVLDYMMMWDQLAVQEELLDAHNEEIAKQVSVDDEESVEGEDGTEAAKTETKINSGDSEAAEQPEGEAKAFASVVSPDNTTPPNSPDQNSLDQSSSKQNGSVKNDSAESLAEEESNTEEIPLAEKQANSDSNLPDSDTPNHLENDSANNPPIEKGAWMRRMRHIMAFKSLPPANIKELLERMESIKVKKGERIVSQGEEGDSFYVLTDGNAQVTRTIELAELKAGASFGEESLVSGGQRNASITMTTDGVLMKLSKQDFDNLLKEPMLNRVSPDEGRNRAFKGDRWLDVRHASEYHHSHLHNANNMPLHEIRMRMVELDKTKHYICYCNTGRRSSAAAFILAQAGYKVSVLNGGVRVMPQDLVKD